MLVSTQFYFWVTWNAYSNLYYFVRAQTWTQEALVTCSRLLGNKQRPIRGDLDNRGNPVLILSHNTHLWTISGFIVTYVWHTCDVLVTDLWPTCDLLVSLLLLTCDYIWKSFENWVKFSLKLRKMLLKIPWNFRKNYVIRS